MNIAKKNAQNRAKKKTKAIKDLSRLLKDAMNLGAEDSINQALCEERLYPVLQPVHYFTFDSFINMLLLGTQTVCRCKGQSGVESEGLDDDLILIREEHKKDNSSGIVWLASLVYYQFGLSDLIMEKGFLSPKGRGDINGVKEKQTNVADVSAKGNDLLNLDTTSVFDDAKDIDQNPTPHSVTNTLGAKLGILLKMGLILQNIHVRKSVNFPILVTPMGNRADVDIPLESIRAISEQFSDTTYDAIVVFMPKLVSEGLNMCTIRVEYEWKSPTFLSCKVFGHVLNELVSNKNGANTSGKKKEAEVCRQKVSNSNPFDALNSIENDDDDLGTNGGSSSSAGKGVAYSSISITPIAERIDKFERQLIEGKLLLVDDDGKPLPKVVSMIYTNSDSEVEDVFDEYVTFMASTCLKRGSDSGYVVNTACPISYAKLVNGEPSRKSVNFRILITPMGNDADVDIPLESIRAIIEQFSNTTSGFFLGKRATYLIVAHYVKNTWSKYGLELKDAIVVVMPKLVGEGFNMCTIRVEYKWKPPTFLSCKVFGHVLNELVSNKNGANTSGKKKQAEVCRQKVSNSNPFDALNLVENDDGLGTNGGSSSSDGKGVACSSISITPISERIDKFERQLIEGKLLLVDDDGQPLPKVVSTINADSDSEMEDVFNEHVTFMASTCLKRGSDSGYGTNSLWEQ
nr:hypothetical protein [Tanacetum cinerariifolium]